MCGIVGFAARQRPSDLSWLRAGRDMMEHRGPDSAGEYYSDDGRVGFGHRRLAIIDLSPGGHQPMVCKEGRIRITYNGEIYNFRTVKQTLEERGYTFRSNSDTEVIIAAYKAWGEDCLSRLEGMFAFAIHDIAHNRIFLARDRAGEKPLFYRLQAGELRFASELKALMVDPAFERRIDREALDVFLSIGYIPGDRCILTGAKKLPPAHAMSFDLASGDLRVWCYWDLPDYDANAFGGDDTELIEELERRLSAAVGRQLVADVPAGVLLSGGVDSSLITALAAREVPRLRTFTVGNPDDRAYDETSYAQLIADHFDTDHTILDAADATPDLLPLLARQYDEPINDSSMIPTYLVSRAIRAHCKVALGGDGGDELFGGYYSASRMAELQQLFRHIPVGPRRAVSTLAQRHMPLGMKGRAYLSMIGFDLGHELPVFAPYFNRHQRARLLKGEVDSTFSAEDFRSSRVPDVADGVQRITRFDFKNYMPEDILVKIDRASMLNSLELRAPFLDPSVIDLAFRCVPSRLKASPMDRKIILKQLSSKLLPPTFDKTRKQGFGFPLGTWLRGGPWKSAFEDVLFDADSLFEPKEVRSLFAGVNAGRPVHGHLFCLAIFEFWRREYGASL